MGNFKRKRQNLNIIIVYFAEAYLISHISRDINPTNNRFENQFKTMKSTSWVVRYYPKANATWLTAAGWSDLDEIGQPDAE